MGIVEEAIQDGVSVGGIADGVVPGRNVELAGDDRGFSAVAILEDFEEVVAGLSIERLQPPYVDGSPLAMAERIF